jgi:undecaprenyl diphosphate synthase
MIQHVAFIMDGNRRWAREHHLPLFAGHTKGYQAIESLISYAVKKKIPHLTFWAFSTENWNRDKKEVEILLQIFRKIFAGEIVDRLYKNGAKINILGNINLFPKDIVDNIKKMVEMTRNNTTITVNIGLNYGGRDEIVHAVNSLLKEKIKSHAELVSASPETLKQVQGDKFITEEEFSQYLYTVGQPDPDLIIRTSGEKRLSGFFPWQSVYSELYFPKIYWPDFNEQEFEKALEEYVQRKRNFGT